MNRTASAVGATLLALALAGCAGGETEPSVTTEGAVILDVRTSAEYDDGHVEGAQLLDLNGGDLAAALPTLDPDVAYLVYCASGNRSGQAVELMAEAGLRDVTDLGSLDEAAAATQLPIVR